MKVKKMRKLKHSFMAIVALALVIASFPSTPVQAENSKESIKSIVANTYIGDGGAMVSSFELEVSDITFYKDLKAEDFQIDGNYDGYPLDKEGKIAQSNYEDDGYIKYYR